MRLRRTQPVRASTTTTAPRRHPERERGFSLLEVVFAVEILTVLTLGVLLVILPVSRQLRINRELDIATTETRKVLEKIQCVPFFQITTIYPDGIDIPLPALDQGLLTVSYDDPTEDPLVVRADLTWNSPELGTMNRSFVTVRTE